MTTIVLNEKKCTCGRTIGIRFINIVSFSKEMFQINEATLDIWKDKKRCWRCKKKPELGEVWGMSINEGEKNRIFCPTCSCFIKDKLEGINNPPRRLSWEEFKNQSREYWENPDDLTLRDLKEINEMCKDHEVTMKELTEIVQDISIKFDLSPNDSFKIFQNKGYYRRIK